MAKAFGRSWWGRAWLDALASVADDDGRLARGRTLARSARGTAVSIGPGAAAARFDGGTVGAHIGLRVLRDDEWEAVVDSLAGRAGHAAALLEGRLPPEVVDDARAVEVDLLPRPRDLRTSCTCPDEAEPCVHAAAVCFLLADALDEDPFVLLLLRGRRREEVLDLVRARRRVRADPGDDRSTAPVPDPDGGEPAVPGPDLVDAAEAWTRPLVALPPSPPLPDAPGRPGAWPSDPPPHLPFDADGLRALATDAARRAWHLQAGLGGSGLEHDHRVDLARRAASTDDAGRAVLADNAGLAPVDLDGLAAAWTHGGPGGVRAHDEPRWDPAPAAMVRARGRVTMAGLAERRVHVSGNRITGEGRVQYRLSRDGLWYRFSKESGRWALSAPPEAELDDLLDLGH